MLEILDRLGTPAMILGAAVLVWERIRRLQDDVVSNSRHIEGIQSRISHLEGRCESITPRNHNA
tara:strand:+ start:515 stop:706 length:192 start_codon:yes stop_codon:yes gene_type:complete